MKLMAVLLMAGFLTAGEVVLVDSSGNPYSGWTQIQECLAFNPAVGGLQFVNLGYSSTGILNAHQTNATFSFWIHDMVMYNASLGNARYPHSVAGTNPYISFPVLDTISGTWGHMGAVHEEGGWFSSGWDDPVDLGPGNVGVGIVIGKVLPDDNVLFIGTTTTDMIIYRTWDPGLTNQISSGTFTEGDYLTGADVNNGMLYLFYQSTATTDMFYRTTTDGITWSGATAWNITWPTPFTSNIICWQQMAITDAGDPIYVFEVSDGGDITYPYNSKVYVQTASGATPVQLSDDSYAASWYPTVATGGNWVQVIMSVWTNGIEDSLARVDVFATGSPDNGTTWSGLVNLTAAEPNRPGLPQIAKRVDATNGNFFYFYGINLVVDLDIYWAIDAGNDHRLDATGWYVAWHPVGIEEHEAETPGFTSLNISPNPSSHGSAIEYTLSKSGTVSLRLFDAAGRLVRNLDDGYKQAGVYSLSLNVSELSNGTYFLSLKTATDNINRSFVVLH